MSIEGRGSEVGAQIIPEQAEKKRQTKLVGWA